MHDVKQQVNNFAVFRRDRMWWRVRHVLTVTVVGTVSHHCFGEYAAGSTGYGWALLLVGWMGIGVCILTAILWTMQETKWSRMEVLYKRQVALMEEMNRREQHGEQDK